MKDTLNKAIGNPIGTAILIGTITAGIANIVRAIKGTTK